MSKNFDLRFFVFSILGRWRVLFICIILFSVGMFLVNIVDIYNEHRLLSSDYLIEEEEEEDLYYGRAVYFMSVVTRPWVDIPYDAMIVTDAIPHPSFIVAREFFRLYTGRYLAQYISENIEHNITAYEVLAKMSGIPESLFFTLIFESEDPKAIDEYLELSNSFIMAGVPLMQSTLYDVQINVSRISFTPPTILELPVPEDEYDTEYDLEEITSLLSLISSRFLGLARDATVGAVVGGSVAIIIILFIDFMKDSIRNENEIRDTFEIPILASINMQEKRNYLDRLLDRLEYGCDPETSISDQIAYLAFKLKLAYNRIENERLLFLGQLSKTDHRMFSDLFLSNDELKDYIDFISASDGNILDFQKMLNCNAIIIIAKRGTTTLRNIDREIVAAKELGKPIKGFVLL